MQIKEKTPIGFSSLEIAIPQDTLTSLDRDTLNDYLGALFLLRHTLLNVWAESSQDLRSFNVVLSSALMAAENRRGLSELMGEAQMLGWVVNGVEILSLVEPHLRARFERMKLVDQENLEHIPKIGVVGKIASGKGTVGEIMQTSYDAMSFPFSDRLRAVALTMGITPPYIRQDLRRINNLLKPAFGNQIFVEWTMLRAQRIASSLHTPQIIVVDGFRSVEETEFFLSLPNTHLVAIIASENEQTDREIRFQRQLKRKRGLEDSFRMDDFVADDMIESVWIDPVIALARKMGHIILNNSDRNTLTDDVLGMTSNILALQ